MDKKEYDKIMKQIWENQDTAIRLLNENIELKRKEKLYNKLIEDTAERLNLEKEDGKIITDDERKNIFQQTIEKNMEYILEEINIYE